MLLKIMCKQVPTFPIGCYATGRMSFQLKLCTIFGNFSVWSNTTWIHCRYGTWKYKKINTFFFSNPEIDGLITWLQFQGKLDGFSAVLADFFWISQDTNVGFCCLLCHHLLLLSAKNGPKIRVRSRVTCKLAIISTWW